MITVAAMANPGSLRFAVAASLFALTAGAQPAEPAPTVVEDPPTDTAARWNARTPTTPPDQRSGHLMASGSAGWVIPFGTVSDDASQSARFGSGLGYQLDVGYGVGRSVVVGLWGQLLTLGDGSACDDCGGTSLAGGPFVRYHLVQGLRFDPWFSYGLGVRFQSHEVGGVDRKYVGIDWARLQFGSDWYALPQLGFGPFVELGTGTFFSCPDDESAGGLYWRFMAGLRVAVDFPGH